MWLSKHNREILHRIELTEEQAHLCVVAEQEIRMTQEDKIKFGGIVGGFKPIARMRYEESFTPLPDYRGGFILPEVLIPFEVECKVDWLRTVWLKFLARFKYFNLFEYPTG